MLKFSKLSTFQFLTKVIHLIKFDISQYIHNIIFLIN
jgi:hypothetical protein